jgi:hypothetical protein
MSQIANVEMSNSERAPRTSSANHNLTIAATLLGLALALIAAQLIFVGNSADALKAATDATALGTIAP